MKREHCLNYMEIFHFYLLSMPICIKVSVLANHTYDDSRILTLVGNPENVSGGYVPYRGIVTRVQSSTMANGNDPEFAGWNEDEQCWEVRTTQSSNSYTYLYSNETFDVTGYKWLIVRCHFRGYATNSNLVGLVAAGTSLVTGNAGTSFAAKVQAVSSSTATTTFAAVDVSSLSGFHRLAIEVAGSSGNYKGTGRIYRAWLSKN